MELTPELFEKTEFTERRKGYDIDQVEKFLEDAGTSLAHLLVQTRRTEERAAAAEGRLGEVDSIVAEARDRVLRAEARAKQAESSAAESRSAAGLSEEAEVEQAAKTLLMARRTGEAMEAEARSQAQSLLGEAKSRAERQLGDAQAESEEMLHRARAQAEEELADRRALVLGQVEALEARRTQLSDVVMQLEARLAAYREDLSRTADELTLLASDPDRLGARPPLSIPPDEVVPGPDATWSLDEPEDSISPSPAVVDVDDPGGSGEEATSEPEPESVIEARSMTAEVRAVNVDDGGPPTQAHPPTAADRWETDDRGRIDPGATDVPPQSGQVQMVSIDGDPVTGSVPQARDRYLQELDDATNEDADSDEAMTAFFEGSNEVRNRRFGWRR